MRQAQVLSSASGAFSDELGGIHMLCLFSQDRGATLRSCRLQISKLQPTTAEVFASPPGRRRREIFFNNKYKLTINKYEGMKPDKTPFPRQETRCDTGDDSGLPATEVLD